MTVIFDGHLDLAWNALSWNRDLEQPVAGIRAFEKNVEGKGRGANTVSLPEMRRGGIGLAMVTVMARVHPRGPTTPDFASQEIASAVAQGQLAWYRMLERRGICRLLRDRSSLDAAFADWRSRKPDAPFGFILNMEGADPIVSPGDVGWWWEAGLRVVALTHYGPGAYAHGTGSPGGLTSAGRELLRTMEQIGLILDMSHLSDESFREAADAFHGPILASHNGCRALVPGARQLADDQIRLLIERDGVIGSPLDAWMMVPEWTTGRKPPVTLEDAVRHIDHICQLAGDARHVAIGSDLDGGFGREQSPADLDTIADLAKLDPLLRQRGFSPADVERIFHGNWLRLFEKAWG